jgi:TAT-translocated FGD2 family F420-dependent dehydrogenase
MERGIGFVLAHEQFPPSDLVEFAVAAEEAGFDGVWTSDHFHPWQDNQGHCGHAWITLAAIGARTEHLAIGTGVTCPIYRYHPAIVAQAFASLSALYPDRVFLGVGTGEALNEASAGGGWGPYRERSARLREAITLIRRLWTEDWVASEGPAFPLPDARLYTKPSRPVPIYVAASGPRSAALAGELGDGWIMNSDEMPPQPEVADAYRAGAAAAGKDPQRLPVLAEHYVVVGDEEEALEAARLWLFGPVMPEVIALSDPRVIQRRAEEISSPERTRRPWVVSRDPAIHVQHIEALFAAGATHVYVHSPQADQRKVIEFYAREVLPAVSKAPRA